MARYIISVTSTDRSGIIAAVTEGIFDCSGNILAASQTVHQGYFAMIVLADFDATPSETEVADAIRGHADFEMHIFVTPHEPAPLGPDTGSNEFIVTCLGADKPGILRGLSRFLASRGINIDDLYCTVEDDEFVELTPRSLRLRKRHLKDGDRRRLARSLDLKGITRNSMDAVADRDFADLDVGVFFKELHRARTMLIDFLF